MSNDELELNDEDLKEMEDAMENKTAGPETKELQAKVTRRPWGWWLTVAIAVLLVVGIYPAWYIFFRTTDDRPERLAAASRTERRTAPPPSRVPAVAPMMTSAEEPDPEDEGESDVVADDEDLDTEVEEAVADQAEAAIAEHEAEEEATAEAPEPSSARPEPVVETAPPPPEPPPAFPPPPIEDDAPTEVASTEPENPCRVERPTETQRLACYDRLIAMADAISHP